MKKFNFWWLLLLIPALLGGVVAFFEPFPEFEKAVFDTLQKLPKSFDEPLKFITNLGGTIGVVSITVLIFVSSIFFKKFFTVGLPVALTVIISRIVNIALKASMDRPRPEFRLFPNETETSFPSGHSQNNMALYIALLLVLLLIIKAPKPRIVLKVVLITLPLIIGITRLYFGVHYISDVIAGWSVGALLAIVVHYFYFKVLDGRKLKNAD